jgi:hypothetical protein
MEQVRKDLQSDPKRLWTLNAAMMRAVLAGAPVEARSHIPADDEVTLARTYRGWVLQELLPSEVVIERTHPVPEWGMTLVERMLGPEASSYATTDYLVRQPDGKERLLATNLAGDGVVILLQSRRFISCERNTFFAAEAPVLIDLNGKVLRLAAHPGFLRDCSRVGSGEEVLFHYNMWGKSPYKFPYNLVRVFDGNGKMLLETTLVKAGSVEFTVAGHRYSERIPEPQEPTP